MLEESPHNDVQEDGLSSKEIIDQSQSNEGLNNHLSKSVRASPPPKLAGSSENPHPIPPVDEEEEREYGCRYCEKVFSNKQALGGHMNAHKLERTIEKNILNRQMANTAYPPHNNFNGWFFYRSQEFFNRAMMNMPYFAQQCTMHHGIMCYGRAPRPLPRINEGYPGWPMPVPGNVTQFMAHPRSLHVENLPPTIHFSTPRSVPSRNFLGEISNLQMNGQDSGVENDSGLDLTLRL
ncbi:zinc finger 1-like [Olea europaea subsp. europaea]|uniref:Zinc finger 1-like n=1 Tax=Olea europaea subsp. europaea TaxID=158383 RepID=A0A8S0QWQ3_OLEEU|nr:zinc finger 1-like [Olea europaea subsp. europaea]